MTKEQQYRIVVRDECMYEKVIEASSHAEAREKAEDNISSWGFHDWQPLHKPVTTIVNVLEEKE